MVHHESGWLQYKDYLSGGLYALLCLDIGMYLAHILVESSTRGYSLFSLIFIIAGLALFHIEKLYSEQDSPH